MKNNWRIRKKDMIWKLVKEYTDRINNLSLENEEKIKKIIIEYENKLKLLEKEL
jgi:hypothetical protein